MLTSCIRRTVILVVAAMGIWASFLAPALAQNYPNRTVKVVVPSSAGGGTDHLARLTTQALASLLNQSFVIENKPDASGITGAHAVASATADGYTLMFNASTHLITPYLIPGVPFDAEKDFSPITEVGRNPYVLSVTPSMGVNTFADFVTFAKAHPGEVRFGTAGVGTPDHIALLLLEQALQIKTLVVPYKGGAPALQGILSGTVQAVMLPPSSIKPHVQAGKLKALAITSAESSDAMPDTPTIAASGYQDYQFYSWYGLWGPKGMPADRVQQIQSAVTQVVTSDDFKRRAAELGFIPVGSPPAAFAEFVKTETARYGSLIKARNLLQK